MRTLLSKSVTWQAICKNPHGGYDEIKSTVDGNGLNADDEAYALDRIAGDLVDDETGERDCEDGPPQILLAYGPDTTITKSGSGPTWDRNSSLVFTIEHPVPTVWRSRKQVALTNGYIDQLNKVGMILHEIQELISGTGSYLQVDSFEQGPMGLIAPEEANGEWIRSAQFTARFTGMCHPE
jgi:hypothetical protein